MEVGDISEGGIVLKISSDHIFNPDRPKYCGISNQRGMAQATKPGASNDILTAKCNDNILLRIRVKGSRNHVTVS